MIKIEYKKKLYELWDEFWLSDGSEAVELGESFREYLALIPHPDEEDYYLWGLSIYSLGQQNGLEDSHPLFQKSLDRNSNYYLARLYSGHCYHDKCQYAEALSEYLKVDKDLLRSEMPIWRLVKLLEQIGFCYIKLGEESKAGSYFEGVIKSYLEIDKDELVPIQEAYECLPANHPLVRRLKNAENEHFK